MAPARRRPGSPDGRIPQFAERSEPLPRGHVHGFAEEVAPVGSIPESDAHPRIDEETEIVPAVLAVDDSESLVIARFRCR
jgi:hypothetical protein